MAEDKDLHRDPVTGEAESHPVGTGVGAVGGAIAGAAAGTAGGPAGMVIGGIVGAVVGGLAGRAAAEAIDPAAEDRHWRDNYTREPYYEQDRSYDDYAPAYRLGVTGRTRYDNWDAAEPQLANEWQATRGASSLDWDDARPASQAAWARVDSSMRGGAMSTLGVADVPGTDAASTSGDEGDVIDVMRDLVECSLDGEYGFRACAEQAKRPDLKSTFLKRADDCRRAAQELNEQIRASGGHVEEHGSTAGALHRGWVAVKSALSTYDDKAVLEEAERGEDNAKARYTKALRSPMPAHLKLIVERQMEGLRRNHDQVKMLRDELRAEKG